MRVAATLLVWKRFTPGPTPGRLLKVATWRSAGQLASRSARSCRLVKVSKGVMLAAAASSALANTVMLLSLSMVNVFIAVLSWHGVAVTFTFITPVGETGKRNLTESLGWRRGGDDAAEWDFGYGKAHVISSQAYTALKQPEKAQFHHNVAGGLLHSIFSTGDGNTKETAFEVTKGDPKLVEHCDIASKVAQLRTASDTNTCA